MKESNQMSQLVEPIYVWIYIEGKKEIIKERILLAYHNKTKKIEAIGKEAETYFSHQREDISVCSPIVQGLIYDYTAFVCFLKSILEREKGKAKLFTKPKIEICIPTDIYINEVYKKAYADVVYQIGGKSAYLIQMPFEEIIQQPHLKGDIVIGIIMEDKKAYLKEQLEQIKVYANKNKLNKEDVLALLEEVYSN